jgi:transcriptional regulator with XRE-family HTH domain
MTDFWLARGLRLRELREAKGMSRYALAHHLAMSDAQLRQIEENDSSLFYSAAIRATAVRKVADFLGEPLVSTPATENSALPVAMNPPRVCYQAVKPVNSSARHRTHWVRFSQWLRTVWRPALLGVLAIVAVSLWVKGTTKIQLTRASDATTYHPAPEASAIKLLTLGAPTVPDSMQDTDAFCGKTQGPIAAFTPPKSSKEGDLVYVVGSPGQLVCLRDSRGQVWRHEFTMASGRSFYGRPPWLVESPHLGAMQVYFQGALARPPNPASMRLRLIAASHL